SSAGAAVRERSRDSSSVGAAQHESARDKSSVGAAQRELASEPRSRHSLAFLDGAARAWPELDAAERTALASWGSVDTPRTAITGAMGQLGGATSVVQAIMLAEALGRGVVPPIAGLANPAAGPLCPVVSPTPTTATAALAFATGAPGLASA